MWEAVDLRELRVFLTLAEELHFGRTAERLRLTPSRVSQSLRSLEAKLGGQLVHRTSRRVELTPLGARFNQEASAAYVQLTSVLQRAHAANRALEGTLRLGLLSGPAGGPHLGAITDSFVAVHPECEVEVEQVSWTEDPFAQLRRDELHVMASWLPLAQPDLVIGPMLASEPRVLAVAQDHPLASRDEVSVEDLADYKVARFEELPRELHEAWIPSHTPTGRVIPSSRMRPPDRDMVGMAVRIARGDIVHPTAHAIATYLGDFDITFVPISDMPRCGARSSGADGAAIRAFANSSGSQTKSSERPAPRSKRNLMSPCFQPHEARRRGTPRQPARAHVGSGKATLRSVDP